MQKFKEFFKNNKNIIFILIIFFLVYSFGIFHKYGRLSVYGDEVHVIFSVLKFFRDWNFTDPYAYAFPVMTILYLPFFGGYPFLCKHCLP